MKTISFICALLLVNLTFAQKKVVPQKKNAKKSYHHRKDQFYLLQSF